MFLCVRYTRFFLGRIILTKTEPFGALNEEGDVAEEAVKVIASRFIFESKMCVVPLIVTINETLKRLYRCNSILEDDKDEGGDDIDDKDAGQDQPPTKGLSNLSLKGAATSTSVAVNSKTQAKNSSSGKRGGSTAGGSRRSLGTLEPNIMLTAEALYHHNNNITKL